MSQNIKAIFLDLGDTLRLLIPDETHQNDAKKRIVELVGTKDSPDEFCEKLHQRYKDYRVWAFENMAEAPETEFWTRWMTPEFPPERIAPVAVELSFQYRQTKGRRIMASDGKMVIEELYKRGYILGIISNLITSNEVPDWLEEEHLTHYFKSVALSSVLGIRKPDPRIYHYAARQAGVEPAECAYIGDNLKRDVTGTQQAGFGMTIIVLDENAVADAAESQPDLIIHSLSELLNVFPPLN